MQKALNVLISTTSNWNPGDDFIRYGVKQLLNASSSREINYIHYDRNPDYFKSDAWEMGTGSKSNIMNEVEWRYVDMVVLAGSPEFIHGPLKPIYDGLKAHPNIPLLAIGVGYSIDVNNIIFTPEEEFVLKRTNTHIITRQYNLQSKLTELLKRDDILCLPCPAIFASPLPCGTNDRLLAVRQSPHSTHQPISLEDNLKTSEYLQRKQYDTIVHYIDDLKYHTEGYFSSDPRELFDRILKYKRVVSNRLHGGLIGLGAQATVKFINSDQRVQWTLEPFAPYLNANGWYYMTHSQRQEIEKQYINNIKGWL